MKFLVLIFLLNCGVNAQSQVVPDSLLYIEQQLNLKFLVEAKDFFEDTLDFVMVRVNDSLSDEKNSYSSYYSKNLCTHGGSVFFDTSRVLNGTKYQLLYGSIGFSYANGKSDCVNRLLSEDYLKVMTPFLKSGEFYPKHSDLTSSDYLIYGRIGGKYIYEVFNRDYPLAPENSKYQEFVNLFINLYDDSDFGE